MEHTFRDSDKRRVTLSIMEDVDGSGDLFLTIEVTTPSGHPKILTSCAYLSKSRAQEIAADLLGMPIEGWLAAKRATEPVLPFADDDN